MTLQGTTASSFPPPVGHLRVRGLQPVGINEPDTVYAPVFGPPGATKPRNPRMEKTIRLRRMAEERLATTLEQNGIPTGRGDLREEITVRVGAQGGLIYRGPRQGSTLLFPNVQRRSRSALMGHCGIFIGHQLPGRRLRWFVLTLKHRVSIPALQAAIKELTHETALLVDALRKHGHEPLVRSVETPINRELTLHPHVNLIVVEGDGWDDDAWAAFQSKRNGRLAVRARIEYQAPVRNVPRMLAYLAKPTLEVSSARRAHPASGSPSAADRLAVAKRFLGVIWRLCSTQLPTGENAAVALRHQLRHVRLFAGYTDFKAFRREARKERLAGVVDSSTGERRLVKRWQGCQPKAPSTPVPPGASTPRAVGSVASWLSRPRVRGRTPLLIQSRLLAFPTPSLLPASLAAPVAANQNPPATGTNTAQTTPHRSHNASNAGSIPSPAVSGSMLQGATPPGPLPGMPPGPGNGGQPSTAVVSLAAWSNDNAGPDGQDAEDTLRRRG